MRIRTVFIRVIITVALLGGLAAAESPLDGTWQGKMDGVPAVAVTVKDNGGKLSGTVTFYRIVNDGSGPRAEGKNTSDLVNPKLEGKTLSFQVRNPNNELSSFQMELTAENEAILKGGKVKRREEEATDAPPLKMTRE